ncbi:hypothetical protein ACVI1J_003441 [Bradyrhizobium diazoefficiens]
MIEGISAITLGTHDMARASTVRSGSNSCMAARPLHSPAFTPGPAIST